MKLYRGDTRDKGSELRSTPDVIDYVKNKAGFLFFTDNIDEATDYAVDALNPDLRENYGYPNITEVEVNGANILDFVSNFKACSGLEDFRFLNERLFDGKMTFEQFNSLTRLDVNYYNELVSGKEVFYSLNAVHLANGITGVFFKEALKKAGYDGFRFKDTCPSKGIHFGFVAADKLKVVNRYNI